MIGPFLFLQTWSSLTVKKNRPRWRLTRSRPWWWTYYWMTWTTRTRHRPSFTRMSQESLPNLRPLLNKSFLNLVCLPPVWMEHWTWPIQCLYFYQCHVFKRLFFGEYSRLAFHSCDDWYLVVDLLLHYFVSLKQSFKRTNLRFFNSKIIFFGKAWKHGTNLSLTFFM